VISPILVMIRTNVSKRVTAWWQAYFDSEESKKRKAKSLRRKQRKAQKPKRHARAKERLEKLKTEGYSLLSGFKPRKDHILPLMDTYVFGISFCLLVALVVSVILTSYSVWLVGYAHTPSFWYILLAASVLSLAIIFPRGFSEGFVPVNHRGVITILGRRRPHVLRKKFAVLGEGHNWIIPWKALMSMEDVDVSIQILDIPPTSKDAPFEVWTLGEDPELAKSVSADGRVEMLCRITIRYQVFCSFQQTKIGKGGIEAGMRSKSIGAIRAIAAHMTDMEFMQNKATLGDAIANGSFIPNSQYDPAHPEKGPKEIWLPGMDEVSKKEWGIDTLGVIIQKADPRNERIKRAYERLTVERREAQAEAIKFDGMRTQTETTAALYKRLGLTEQQAAMEAIIDTRSEQDFTTGIHVTGTQDNLLAAAAIITQRKPQLADAADNDDKKGQPPAPEPPK
jgi:hypothetical protein